MLQNLRTGRRSGVHASAIAAIAIAGTLLAMRVATSGHVFAQTASATPGPATPKPNAARTEPELMNFPDLTEQGAALLEQARAGNGRAMLPLAHYRGHETLLMARTTSGDIETDKGFAEFLFVLAGQGTVLTGGKIVEEDMTRRLVGAVPRALVKGDVIHIPAGMPHQTLEAAGQSLTLYVVRVKEPAAPIAAM